jgi:hypothetical protein
VLIINPRATQKQNPNDRNMLMSNFKSLLVTFAFYTFSFACSGSTERTFTEENDAKEIESETLIGSYDSAIVPETNETNDTNDTNNSINDTGTNTTVDSGPLKNESGALIINGQCIPKTKYQIEQDYTASINKQFTSDGFGDYDQFIACGVHDDGCGGMVDFGANTCPADPEYLPNNGKFVAGKDIATASTNFDAGAVKRLTCGRSGFCLGICRIAKAESLPKMSDKFPLTINTNTTYALFTGATSDGVYNRYNSSCKIIPKFVMNPNSCGWYIHSVIAGNYMECNKY